MRVGVVGVGVVGMSLVNWLKRETDHEVVCLDPPRGYLDPVTQVEALFICVPAPTVGYHQDLSIIESVLKECGRITQRIFIRSTVTPGTSDKLSERFGLRVYSMPEFLTERIAHDDIDHQGVICGGRSGDNQHEFLLRVFNGKKQVVVVSNAEAEIAKYMHNGNGAVKVHFNNLIHQLCLKLGADYERVRLCALMSGYVSETHTLVPGPDGRLGYGGKCFPKDLQALYGLMLAQGIPCESLAEVQQENTRIRGVAL